MTALHVDERSHRKRPRRAMAMVRVSLVVLVSAIVARGALAAAFPTQQTSAVSVSLQVTFLAALVAAIVGAGALAFAVRGQWGHHPVILTVATLLAVGSATWLAPIGISTGFDGLVGLSATAVFFGTLTQYLFFLSAPAVLTFVIVAVGLGLWGLGKRMFRGGSVDSTLL